MWTVHTNSVCSCLNKRQPHEFKSGVPGGYTLQLINHSPSTSSSAVLPNNVLNQPAVYFLVFFSVPKKTLCQDYLNTTARNSVYLNDKTGAAHQTAFRVMETNFMLCTQIFTTPTRVILDVHIHVIKTHVRRTQVFIFSSYPALNLSFEIFPLCYICYIHTHLNGHHNRCE